MSRLSMYSLDPPDDDDEPLVDDDPWIDEQRELEAVEERAALYDEREDIDDPDEHDTDIGVPCPACDGEGEVYSHTHSFGRWSLDPPEPVFKRCEECDGRGIVPGYATPEIEDTEFRNDDFIEDGYLSLVDIQGRETLYIEDGILEPA